MSKPNAADQSDTTPRPRKRGLPYDGAGDRGDDNASSLESPSVSSSKSSRVSRGSSPRKQLLNAASHPYGFLTRPLTAIAKPPSLDALILSLDEVGDGSEILPHYLRDQVITTPIL